MLTTSAYAQNVNQTVSGGNDLVMLAAEIALVIFVFYLFVFRPMDKQKRLQEALLSGLKKGDEVVTSSGLIGKILKLDDKEVTLEMADGAKMRVLRSTITGLYGSSLPDKTK